MGDYLQSSSDDIVPQETLIARNAKVLVVDDNDMNLKVASNLLGLFRIRADLSPSGVDAMEQVAKEHYNLVLLDHMMPEMDGLETLEKMRSENILPEDTKVIALTANAINGAKEEYLNAGFDDYLSKPIEVEALEELLIKWLAVSFSLSSLQELVVLRHQLLQDCICFKLICGFCACNIAHMIYRNI